ncbi:hypothetical protein AFERRI_10137 [Acidithiobacillus ferrivorans]|uniref:Uncharacterized protein n=1 Tax=Acidithiobacillus ferrivorans TaxID=160808 RepID=A0A060V0W7_9PROT|nr:hypothetical protein AFERRI_10137 [Acidithiobacillus ferrivorans]
MRPIQASPSKKVISSCLSTFHYLYGNWGGRHFPFVQTISYGPECKSFNLGRRIVA